MSEDAAVPNAAPRSAAMFDLDAKVAYLQTLLRPGDEAIETHFAWAPGRSALALLALHFAQRHHGLASADPADGFAKQPGSLEHDQSVPG